MGYLRLWKHYIEEYHLSHFKNQRKHDKLKELYAVIACIIGLNSGILLAFFKSYIMYGKSGSALFTLTNIVQEIFVNLKIIY